MDHTRRFFFEVKAVGAGGAGVADRFLSDVIDRVVTDGCFLLRLLGRWHTFSDEDPMEDADPRLALS